MLSLHVSNRTENLLYHLSFLLREDRQADIFAPELFLIQSQGMERMVAQSLTDEFGCFCNFRFFLPLDFLGFIAEQLGLGISPDGFQRQILTWRLDELLRDLDAEVYQPLRYYLSGENTDLKRFQLARRLANIFDQYQLMRSPMLAGWEKGEQVAAHPAERWQMDLWRRLSLQPKGKTHRGELFRQVIDRLSMGDDLSEYLPKRISAIGLHTMPPMFLEYLDRLSRHMDVHLLMLSPCRHYWGDVESRRTELKRMARQSPASEMAPLEHHPLLAALGQQGRDFQNMLLTNVESFIDSDSYDDPLEEEEYATAPLLRQIQADLLDDIMPQFLPQDRAQQDNSIQVVSCHSRLREITVLKDHLLFLLHGDETLELRDIVVMAPDIQEYAALIPAVFADIQHSIADRSMRRRNSIIAAFLSFLELFSGRFGWSEVLDLLRQPVVFPQFQLAATDLDTLQQWVIGSGIRWGLSGAQRREEAVTDFAEGSWRAGLERLLMGYAIDGDEFVDGVLPFTDIEGKGAQPLGGLCRFVEMVEQAREDFRQDRTIEEWSLILQRYVQQLFGDSDEQQLVELQAILAEPAESIGHFHTSTVGYAVIREWLNLSAKESRSSSGFLRGQLTFCSMLPMRSIPFRVVCLLGLNDGVFPKNDNHDTFDLMGTDFRPGDRSPRADDRYQFLEALLAARSHLYLSYVGQSIRTGEVIPPSVVVTEFLELLESSYGARDIVVRHPLHPFSRRYFAAGGDERLFSYNDYYCRTAEVQQRGAPAKDPWWRGQTEEEAVTVHLADLLRFAAGPQKFFIVDRLGIRLDLGAELPDEREMFEPSGLDRYVVEQELVISGLTGRIPAFFAKIQAESRWPLGTPGLIAFDEKQAEAEIFLQRVAAQRMGEPLAALSVDLTLGNYRLIGTLTGLHENGILLIRSGNLRGRDLLTGWICHLVATHLLPANATRLVAKDAAIAFSGLCDGPGLAYLLALFTDGCRRPLPLFIEPAFAFARQDANGKARTPAIDKAVQVYRTRMEKGYEPEWQLLYGNTAAEELLGDEFLQLSREIFCSIWGAADEC
ncbi:MAG: hypothetical protein VR65_16430 [Desulfobulbaceae bacterium BRH_c16a]|nr:MAG: hypothetical protein VR65_16430 [Desulfobulbaceae bacterium BRH_c16a]